MKFKNIKFSVILPILDRKDIIETFPYALESIYKNTLKPDQVIVVIDGLVSSYFKEQIFIFEKNDFFFLIFAIPGSFFMMYGIHIGTIYFPFWIGLGITVYGAAYFFVHDLFIHQRLKVLKNTKNKYLLGIRRGHKVHHKRLSKEQGECFGMLFVPLKYFRQYK